MMIHVYYDATTHHKVSLSFWQGGDAKQSVSNTVWMTLANARRLRAELDAAIKNATVEKVASDVEAA